MAERSVFFDNDEEYSAYDFSLFIQQVIGSSYTTKFIGSGISRYNPFADDETSPCLVVSANGQNMNLTVSTGAAFIAGRFYYSDTAMVMPLANAHASLDRVDRIVLRLDLNDDKQNIRCFVKQGMPSENPVAPALQQDERIKEISLARITLRAGKSFVSPEDVKDEREYKELGGFLALHNLYRTMVIDSTGAITMPYQSFIKTEELNSSFVLKNDAYTQLPIPSVIYDKQGELKGNSFVPKFDGVYALWVELGFQNDPLPAGAKIEIYVYVNGRESFPIESKMAFSNKDRFFFGNGFDQLQAGDEVTFRVRALEMGADKNPNLIRVRIAKIS